MKPLVTIIAGSRTVSMTLDEMEAIVERAGWPVAAVVSGTARGIDLSGEAWAAHRGVPIFRFPADWSAGRGAGLARNERMAQQADALIAVWDGESRGTAHMIARARFHGLLVHVERRDAVHKEER